MTSTQRTSRIRRRPLLLALALTLVGLVGTQPALSSLGVFTDSATGPVTTVTALSPYSRAVLADNPMAYYPLDERSGTTAHDITAGARHGTYINDGAATVSTGGASIPLNAGGSAVFNGGRVNLSGLPVPTAPGTKVTVEFWIHLPVGGFGNPMVFSMGANDLFFTGNQFGFNTGNADHLYIPEEPLYARPAHVAVVMGNYSSPADYAANRKMYIDGALQTLTQQGVPAVRPLSSDLQISGWPIDSQYRLTAGTRISDFAIYNGELSASKIQNHYVAGQSYANKVLQDNPVAYWKFDEPAGSVTFTDFTQRAYTGTYPAAAQRGQPGLIRDGKPSTNWNKSGFSTVTVPTMNSAAGATTTIEMWINTTEVPTNAMVMGTGGYTVWVCPPNVCIQDVFGVNNGGNNMRGIPWSQIGTGTHHIVLTMVNGNHAASRIWVDGTEKTMGNYGGALSNAASVDSNVRIGGVNAYLWPGRIDEVALYNGLLSNDTIMAHYRAGR